MKLIESNADTHRPGLRQVNETAHNPDIGPLPHSSKALVIDYSHKEIDLHVYRTSFFVSRPSLQAEEGQVLRTVTSHFRITAT